MSSGDVAALGEPGVAAPQADQLVAVRRGACRVTARITAFRPGQSPPAVRTPIFTRAQYRYGRVARCRALAAGSRLESRRSRTVPVARALLKALLARCAVALASRAAAPTRAAAARCRATRSRSSRACRSRARTAEQSQSIVNAEKLALQRGRRQGRATSRSTSPPRTTRPRAATGAGLGSGQDRRERPQGGRGHAHDRLHRRLRLGRDGDLAADHERGRVRAGEPRLDRGRA